MSLNTLSVGYWAKCSNEMQGFYCLICGSEFLKEDSSHKVIKPLIQTGNLDSENGRIIIGLLKSLKKSGQTICMVTHDKDLSSQVHRIIHLLDGKIVQF